MSNSSQDQVVTQLNRIRGQIDGLVKMYQDERQCVDIVRQVIAARNSLSRVARDLLASEASCCSKKGQTEELDAILKELFKY
jgi:CsoR family transcriptional regulator, copper-sensing transcriptional repressor